MLASFLIPEGQTGQTIIVLFDRGNCTFVQKVRDAQNIAQDPKAILECSGALLDISVSFEGDLIATALEGGTVSLYKKGSDGEFKPDVDVSLPVSKVASILTHTMSFEGQPG